MVQAVNQGQNPFLLENPAAYEAWRETKFSLYPLSLSDWMVDIGDLAAPSVTELAELKAKCSLTNFVFYRVQSRPEKIDLKSFATALDLRRYDGNLCSDLDNISAITVHEDSPLHEGYVPYSNKSLSWHTDGYYNLESRQINAILLHCIEPAPEGGENRIFDHEILYAMLRDENEDYIRVLSEPDVLTIPANIHEGEMIRAAQTGPVFSIHPGSGRLHMRYSARKRNIEWKDDKTVHDAVARIDAILGTDSDYCIVHRFEAGEGILSNNCLHNRSAFTYEPDSAANRLLYRARFYDRVPSP